MVAACTEIILIVDIQRVSIMTFRIVCGKCGSSIYAGMELRYARDVLKVAGGKCPDCKSQLSQKEFVLDVVKARV